MDKLDINKAKLEELVKVKGIGPAKANRIITYRKQKGFFNNIKELTEVKGIGRKYLEKIKDYIKVEDSVKIEFNPADYGLGDVAEVHLVGEMNGWNPADKSYALEKEEDNRWVGCFALDSGTEYKFMYDSINWEDDKHIGDNGLNIVV